MDNVLNGSTIPTQGPIPDAKLAAMGPNQLASSVRLWFVEASPTVEKAVSCYKADWLVASMLSFHSIQSSLTVRESCVAGEEHCKRGYKLVCANFWCHGTQSASEQSQLCELSGPTFGFTTQEFSMVGGCTENPEKKKHKTFKLGGGGLLGYGRLLGTIR